MNTLINLINYGQSYWLDNLTRGKIIEGELKKRVEEQGLRGITSNPSIFKKAISDSEDYDGQISELVSEGKGPQQIYDALTIKDVQDACDILKPVYNESSGVDGFVSLEVSPYLSRDTQGTMKEARRLYKAVDRKNCLIKIPGTLEGIPAIEQMLYEGVNINITLLFSVERYAHVANAYIRAIARRVNEGKPVNNTISVASIFISRIDVLTDQLLAQHVISFEGKQDISYSDLLSGKTGVATARLAYQRFKEIFGSAHWQELKTKGAQVQRPLWASTSNKDPLHNALRYVEPLIGKNTVNTLPDETITAFAEHGKMIQDAIEQEQEETKQFFEDLKKSGIDIDFVTQQLENEGIAKFTASYDELIGNLAKKRMQVLRDKASPQHINPGKLEKEIKHAYVAIDERQIPKLLFAKNPHLWSIEPRPIKEISQRLGWLSLADDFTENLKELNAFATTVIAEGYSKAVLLGMGGSSLSTEVARETFNSAPGYLQLLVLDNTDPAAILDLENKTSLDKTLFIVASKSGNTEETLSFFHYFYEQLKAKNTVDPGNDFVAITDAGTPLVKLAEEYKFKKVFINPSDLGGRYSVLSDFGLLPMALMGMDVSALLSSAKQMESSCDSVPAAYNPGISLGVLLGICQKHGCDKVTFALSSSIKSFGYWVEQLLAESTGKDGTGLIPVNGEELSAPEVYGNDRVFIHVYFAFDENEADIEKIKSLEDAGYPVVRIELSDRIALGGEYFRWEVATAITGMMMDINPFDQPNVEESKINTSDLLEGWKKEGSFKQVEPTVTEANISIYAGKKAERFAISNNESPGSFIMRFTASAKQGDYIALLPYFMMTDHRTEVLQTWRQQLRNELKVATTLLNGPRYLHSTGQLHKGGPDTGLYIILIGEENQELPIPGERFGFATLHQAQALGDFRSLDEKGRRVIRIHLGKDIDAGLDKLYQSISEIK